MTTFLRHVSTIYANLTALYSIGQSVQVKQYLLNTKTTMELERNYTLLFFPKTEKDNIFLIVKLIWVKGLML